MTKVRQILRLHSEGRVSRKILKDGFYTHDEFNLLLEKMEASHWYREKKDKKCLPVLSILPLMGLYNQYIPGKGSYLYDHLSETFNKFISENLMN
ncbi:MAG: hypothetical protein WBP41_12285 [Saprospiraceae bacterium]